MSTQLVAAAVPKTPKRFCHETLLKKKLTKFSPMTCFKVFLDRERRTYMYVMKISGVNYLMLDKAKSATMFDNGLRPKAANNSELICLYGIEEVDCEIRIDANGREL